MNYIVFDLEFNQGYDPTKTEKDVINKKCPFEIIQIGAVKLDENFNELSSFSALVKPEVYTILNPFVQKITGITLEQLEDAKSFEIVFKAFADFLEGNDNILCVWGIVDIKELIRNAEYYNIDTSIIPREYINIQHYTSKFLNCTKGTSIGLKNAVELLEIENNEEFHDAYYDAYYAAEILKKVYHKGMKSSIYKSYSEMKISRKANSKIIVDTCRLFEQFEKMFNRPMNKEEKKIIELAYTMGRTNQFQIKNKKD